MITIFYAKSYFYVPSYHPILISQLHMELTNEFSLIDINTKETSQIKNIISESDLIVFDQSIIEALKFSIEKTRATIYAYYYKIKNTEFYTTIIKLVFNSNKRLCLWASIADAHSIFKNCFDRLLPIGITRLDILNRIEGLIWGYNSSSLIDLNLIDPGFREPWFNEIENPKVSFELIRKYINYDVEIAHCINKREFTSNKKKWDIFIPGIKYTSRKIVNNIAKSNNLYTPDNKYISVLNGKLNGFILKTKILPIKKAFQINYHLMRRNISRSRISYVCGSSLMYLVRKFYEVPAFDSVLLAFAPDNFEDYGFLDGQNYIYTRPEECLDKIHKILSDANLQMRLIKEAKETIVRLHTADKRAKDFLGALQLIRQNNLSTAKFYKGAYTYFDQEGKIVSLNN